MSIRTYQSNKFKQRHYPAASLIFRCRDIVPATCRVQTMIMDP